MTRRLLKLLTALSLALGPWALAGCIYIPGPEEPLETGDPRPTRLVGPRGSRKPFRPGAATREQVVQRFGPPHRQSRDGAWLVYSYLMQGGHWIMLPCVPVQRALQIVAVRFDFDADGVLRAARVVKGPPSRPGLLRPFRNRPRCCGTCPRPTRARPRVPSRHGGHRRQAPARPRR